MESNLKKYSLYNIKYFWSRIFKNYSEYNICHNIFLGQTDENKLKNYFSKKIRFFPRVELHWRFVNLSTFYDDNHENQGVVVQFYWFLSRYRPETHECNYINTALSRKNTEPHTVVRSTTGIDLRPATAASDRLPIKRAVSY